MVDYSNNSTLSINSEVAPGSLFQRRNEAYLSCNFLCFYYYPNIRMEIIELGVVEAKEAREMP